MPEEVSTINPKEEQVEDSQQEEKQDSENDKDRTSEQFEKLTKSNKELKKERDKYKNVLESLTPEKPRSTPQQRYQAPTNRAPSASQFQNLSQQDIDSQFKAMVDEDGYLDGNRLKDILVGLDQRAKKAELKAERVAIQAQKEREARQQAQKSEKMRLVHQQYPQLDPESDQFDEDYYDAVRNELIGQMMEGREDPMEAAKKWHGRFYKDSQEKEQQEMPTKKEKQEAEEKQEQKRQINATRPRSSSMAGYYADEEEEALRQKVRKGKKGALAEALRRHEKRNS